MSRQTQAKKANAQSTKARAPILSKSFDLALFVGVDASDEDDPSVAPSVPVVVDPFVPVEHQV